MLTIDGIADTPQLTTEKLARKVANLNKRRPKLYSKLAVGPGVRSNPCLLWLNSHVDRSEAFHSFLLSMLYVVPACSCCSQKPSPGLNGLACH
jgi:hypothetical protein